MIIGIGTDIIDTRRIKKTITNFGNKLKKDVSCQVRLRDQKRQLIALILSYNGSYFT